MSRFGVYVHFPFCRRRCSYCDFPSQAVDTPPHREYADALLRELEQRAAAFGSGLLSSIYVGGGTPSLWRPAELARVLDGLRRAFPHATPDLEVTVEGNPADVEGRLLGALAAAGVNRLSLGVQSFHDATLATLGRRHDAAEARRALAALQAAPIPRFTFDLIYGVPGQGPAEWEEQLVEALAWQRGHLSIYGLSLEPHTPLAQRVATGELVLPAEEELLAMMRATRRVLGHAGLQRYEVASHARPGEESRHNLLYWRGAPYLGLGAGAHSYLPPERGGDPALRWANDGDPERYLAGPGQALALHEELGPDETARERLLCSLRLAEGLDLARHAAAGGEELRRTRPGLLAELRRTGLVELEGDRLRLSEAGFEVADAVLRALA